MFQSYWVLWIDGRPSRLVSPWASPRVRHSERDLRASGLCWRPTESLGILKLDYITYIQHHTIYVVPFALKQAALSRAAYFHALPFKKVNP